MKGMHRGLEIVVGVLAVVGLAAILFPIFAQVKGSGPNKDLSHVKQCCLGILMYSADFDDVFPYVKSQSALVEVTRPYINNDDDWQTLNQTHPGQFDFNRSLPGVRLKEIKLPDDTPMLFDPFVHKPYAQLFLVGFAGGHASYLSAQKWERAKPMLNLTLKRHGKPIQ